MLEPDQRPVYVCGEYRVDVRRRRLFSGDQPLTVTAKAFDVLVELIRRPGQVVSKDDLMAAVWPDTIVEENNLTQQVSALRKLFNERAGDHRYIATVPGRGYCLVAPVSELADRPVPELLIAGSTTSTVTIDISNTGGSGLGTISFDPGALRGAAIAAAYILTVFMSVLAFGGAGSHPDRPQSVGVLTFRTLGADDDRYGVGIRDTLRAKLGSVDDITVRPAADDSPAQDALAVGRRMNVDVVLAGSVQREQGRIRVAVEIVDVRGERVVWGKTFDDDAANLFELQDSIAAEVARTLRGPKRPRASNEAAGPQLYATAAESPASVRLPAEPRRRALSIAA